MLELVKSPQRLKSLNEKINTSYEKNKNWVRINENLEKKILLSLTNSNNFYRSYSPSNEITKSFVKFIFIVITDLGNL
jgi:hypothetical protein